MKNLLSGINFPDDLRQLKVEQLQQLSGELRDFIIDKCSANPGHFGASLGTVELTVALHYVFNTPYDKIIWDVGHQAYAHKILTGRKQSFDLNRKYNGLSGFPKMTESEYDAFGVGHASTSISAGLGMAIAARLNNEDRKIISVIGDGSITGGMAFEGFNNAGWQNADMLVILNDNNIAIDPNVGALKKYLTEITASNKYNKIKSNVWNLLGDGKFRWIIRRLGSTMKSAVLSEGNFFESLNFRYFGPIDGHDINTMVKTLSRLKTIKGPTLLHVLTKKGKGYKPAEENQTEWHAPGKFNKTTGEIQRLPVNPSKPVRYQDVFGETIVELAEMNPKIVGITPAMVTGCSLNLMMHHFPERTFDVGIAEAHAVTFSAGLAAAGYLPFCNIYSSFMQRAFDSVIHDIALQKLHVVLCLDRGGIVGEDGPTHHGVFDLAYFRLIPNMTVAAPMNEIELRNMLYTAQLPSAGPFSIRYPRGNGVTLNWRTPFEKIPTGKGRILKEGNDIAVLSIGHPGNFVTEAIRRLEAQNISVMHCDMRFLKPIDEDILHTVGKRFKHIVTVEDGTVVGGLGSAVAEFLSSNVYDCKIEILGAPDEFIQQGTVQELYAKCGFDADGIYNAIVKLLSITDTNPTA
ncbi:MAG: 1-deoxy-D-xylulose-5-phosphate synthase [Prevotellaceae bacterium]|jgi:1-deoxy-D-xylulose-5-phosphate synthase|nr:1-deoxy-D-xylulose-5-phosphate synthase [Prevotellaceae bacterium]